MGWTCTARGVFGILLGVLMLGAGGPDVLAQERDHFKVGVITSLSGELAYGGSVTKRGYDLWAETINAEGGIPIGGKRYKVELVYADAQSNPATGALAVERLITGENVDFVLGPYSSGVTLAVAPITEKYRMPHITGSAESPLIWRQGFRYTFGTIPTVTRIATAAIETLAKDVKPAPKTVAIVGIDDAFSKFAAQAFDRAAAEGGLKVVKYEIVPEGIDYTPTMSSTKARNPDILAIGSHVKAAIEMIKAAKELGFSPKAIVQHYGMTTPDFSKGLGKDADSVYGSSVWTANLAYKGGPLFGTPRQYAEAFEKRFGSAPDYTEAACTAAGIVFQVALQKIGATPPLSQSQKDALVETLENIRVETFYGPVEFAKRGEYYHDNIGLQNIALQIQDGKLVEVGPGKLAVVPPRYPARPWGQR